MRDKFAILYTDTLGRRRGYTPGSPVLHTTMDDFDLARACLRGISEKQHPEIFERRWGKGEEAEADYYNLEKAPLLSDSEWEKQMAPDPGRERRAAQIHRMLASCRRVERMTRIADLEKVIASGILTSTQVMVMRAIIENWQRIPHTRHA